MIASLGAARHHLGQPACVITIYLDLMKKKETDPVLREMILQCEAAAATLVDILKRLGEVSQFRTEPYLPGPPSEPPPAPTLRFWPSNHRSARSA
jgi:hypothetical protein